MVTQPLPAAMVIAQPPTLIATATPLLELGNRNLQENSLTQNGFHAVYAWAVFLHLFVNWFPTTIYQSCSEFRPRFLFKKLPFMPENGKIIKRYKS